MAGSPTLLAVRLISALLGDGAAAVVASTALAVPVLAIAWAWCYRRG